MRYDPAIVQSEVIIISLSMFHACGERSVNSVGLAASDFCTFVSEASQSRARFLSCSRNQTSMPRWNENL